MTARLQLSCLWCSWTTETAYNQKKIPIKLVTKSSSLIIIRFIWWASSVFCCQTRHNSTKITDVSQHVTSSMFFREPHRVADPSYTVEKQSGKKWMPKKAMHETNKCQYYCLVFADIQGRKTCWLRSSEKLLPVSQWSLLKPRSPPYDTLHLHKHMPLYDPSDSSET